MPKSFFILFITSLLLFHTAIYAEEITDVPEETIIEDVVPTEEVAQENTESQETQEAASAPDVDAVQEEISEAQKEADAAEAAELQEVGTGEEPVTE